MPNRTTITGGTWALDAPDPPSGTTPAAGTTYGDSSLEIADIEAGWPYSSIVDSAKFNEMMRRLTTLMQMLESQGILTWCAAITYGQGAKVLGSDGNFYHSRTAENLNNDPTASPANWAVNPFYAVAAESGNNYTASLAPAPTALTSGLQVWINIGTPNTAPPTLSLNGLGAVNIVQRDGTSLKSGMLRGIVNLIYDGTNWEFQSSSFSSIGSVSIVGANQAVGTANAGTIYVATAAVTFTYAGTTILGSNFINFLHAEGGAITIAINGSDSINGGAAGAGITILQGTLAILTTDAAGNIYISVQLTQGVADARYELQSNLAADVAALCPNSLGTNGYQKLPNGLIFQWGIHSRSTGTTTITFPIAFPNGCFIVLPRATIASGTPEADEDYQVLGAPSTTQFQVFYQEYNDVNVGSDSGFMWFALGH